MATPDTKKQGAKKKLHEKAKSSVKNRKKTEATSVQKNLPIAEIRNDCLLLKNGGLRAMLLVTSMNFSLKSEEEQIAIVGSYQQFLNTITFPIQIYVRSSKLNVDAYLVDLKIRAAAQENPLIREQTLDYADFIQRMIDVSNIMQKNFYVVVPMDPLGAMKKSFFQKYLGWFSGGDSALKAVARRKQFDELSASLRDRVNLVQTGLEGVGLPSSRLTTQEIIELFYVIYNPETSRNQKLPSLTDLGVKEYAL